MNKLMAIASIIFFLTSCKTSVTGDFVDAFGGLKLRDSAGVSGKVVTVIPDGSKIVIVQKDVKKDTIDGRAGSWHQIKWKDKTGYAFSAFIVNKWQPVDLIDQKTFFSELEKVCGADDTCRKKMVAVDARYDEKPVVWVLHSEEKLLKTGPPDDEHIESIELKLYPNYGGFFRIETGNMYIGQIRKHGNTYELFCVMHSDIHPELMGKGAFFKKDFSLTAKDLAAMSDKMTVWTMTVNAGSVVYEGHKYLPGGQ
jgi:hypothetical protein